MSISTVIIIQGNEMPNLKGRNLCPGLMDNLEYAQEVEYVINFNRRTSGDMEGFCLFDFNPLIYTLKSQICK